MVQYKSFIVPLPKPKGAPVDNSGSTREMRLEQLRNDCSRAYKLISRAIQDAETNPAGDFILQASNLVSGILPEKLRSAFVLSCLKRLGLVSCVNQKSHLWKIVEGKDITLKDLEKVLATGDVFILRGQPNDPYKLQVVEVTHAKKTAEERLKEENAELKKKLAEAGETIEELGTETEKLRTALREALKLAKEICQLQR